MDEPLEVIKHRFPELGTWSFFLETPGNQLCVLK